MPDFSEVYSFIGSVFDPESKGHVQKLKEMDPINFETVSQFGVISIDYIIVCAINESSDVLSFIKT